MHIFLLDAEMLLCKPMEIIIEGPNLFLGQRKNNNYMHIDK